ncbi:MAG: hypothetical protein ACRD1M_16060, partial [Terriglobales bacterium]
MRRRAKGYRGMPLQSPPIRGIMWNEEESRAIRQLTLKGQYTSLELISLSRWTVRLPSVVGLFLMSRPHPERFAGVAPFALRAKSSRRAAEFQRGESASG